MWKPCLSLVIALSAILAWSAEKDGTSSGREVFEKRCTGCHSLDAIKVGPALRGVVGRHAAGDSKFPYSDALKNARLVWDEATLDRWLADPEALVPDSDMSFRLNKPDERSAIIAYLRQLSAQQGRH